MTKINSATFYTYLFRSVTVIDMRDQIMPFRVHDHFALLDSCQMLKPCIVSFKTTYFVYLPTFVAVVLLGFDNLWKID